MMDVKGILFQWLIDFLKKSFWQWYENENILNKKIEKEQYKPITGKFNKKKIHPPFIENFLGADLTDRQLISKFNIKMNFF